MGLLSFTKGELAGFGEGLREDRLIREDREYKDRVREEEREAQLAQIRERFGLQEKAAEDARIEIVRRGVDSIYSALGSKLPASARESVFKLIEGGAYKPETFIEAYTNGTIKWNESTRNARYSLGSMEEMSAYWTQLEQEYDLPSGYLATTASIESNLGKNMVNPRSSAKGIFQFVDGTAKQYGVDVYDWKSSSLGAAKLAAANKSSLQKRLNRTDISGAELYLAHQQGAGGAGNLLSRPTAMAVDVVGATAVSNNLPEDKKGTTFTAQDFSDLYVSKYTSNRKRVEQYVNTPLMATMDGPEAVDKNVDVQEPTGKYGFEVVNPVDDETDRIALFKTLTKDNYEGAARGAELSGKIQLAADIREYAQNTLLKFVWGNVRKENYRSLAEAEKRKGNEELAEQILSFGDSAFAGEGRDSFTKANYAADYMKYLKIVQNPQVASNEELNEANNWFANIKDNAQQVLGINNDDKSEKDKEIDRLMNVLGLDEAMAVKLAYGHLRIRANAVSRNPEIVDLTNNVVMQLGFDGGPISLFEPGYVPTEFEPTEKELAEYRSNAKNEAEVIEHFEKYTSGFSQDLFGADVEKASGFRGQFNAWINGASDYFLARTINEDAKTAAKLIDNLGTITEVSLQAAIPNVRDSVYLKIKLGELTPRVGLGYQENKDKTQNMVTFLEDSVRRLESISLDKTQGINPAAKSKAATGLKQVRQLLEYYRALDASFKGNTEGATAADVMKDPNEVVTTTNTDDELDQVTESGMRWRLVQ